MYRMTTFITDNHPDFPEQWYWEISLGDNNKLSGIAETRSDAMLVLCQTMLAEVDGDESVEKIDTQYVTVTSVEDPYTHQEVEVEIRKLASGPMVGIDASVFDADIDVYSPYDPGTILYIPDDECID